MELRYSDEDMDALREELTACREASEAMRAALQRLIKDYVILLETGRDIMLSLGRECDDLPTMEHGDPALIRAKAALALKPSDAKEST